MIQKCFSLTVMFAICGLLTANANANLVYVSSTFANPVINQNDALGYSVTADVLEGGVMTGSVTASIVYGTGGSDPFSSATLWGPTGTSFGIAGESNLNPVGTDTASGDWNISVAAVAGYQVDGISVFTQGTSIANPDITSITSNGIATLYDGGGLITNAADGSVIANGGSLDFIAGTTSNGIVSDDHSQLWAINVDGSAVSFNYAVGFSDPVNNISFEGLRFDVQTSVAPVPEPSCFAMIGLGMAFLGMRRRR